MEKLLNQAGLNPILGAATERKMQPGRNHGRDKSAVACNFQRAGTLSTGQVQAIRSLHETLARSLTKSLGAYLRKAIEVTVVSVDQNPYSEFLQQIADLNFVCSTSLHPLGALAVVELEWPLALPIVDMLLGGAGHPASEAREITDIEEEILGYVVQLICKELEATWMPVLQLEFRSIQRQKKAQIFRLMPPTEKVLWLSLDIRTEDVQGKLRLAFPVVVANALLKKLDEQGSYRVPTAGSSGTRQFRKVLEQCRFKTELLLPEAAIPAGKLMRLKVGEVLEFPLKVTVPIQFRVENQIFYLAHPVASGDRRAAEIYAKATNDQLVKEEAN